jgi:cyclopropane-fatty-acyl-phospholipid synthase
MASQREIQQTYDFMDRVIRLSLGECPDITGARYDGDYSQTLEEAQRAKHAFVVEAVKLKPGMRLLDIGSGWGPMLRAARDAGADAVGITLSPKQAAACRRQGLEAHVKDWKTMSPGDLGTFDAIVSIGAFEHFCSPEEHLRGEQDAIYRRFFTLCRRLLPERGRLYLQTMVWGSNAKPYAAISLKAPKDSDEYLLALMEKLYPGSWLPDGADQIARDAEGFRLVSADSGRRDYIETMKEWGLRDMRRTALRNPVLLVQLSARYALSRDFRYQVECLARACNRTCFERKIMDHVRMVFESLGRPPGPEVPAAPAATG